MPLARILWICGTSRPVPVSISDFWSLDVQTPTSALGRLHQNVYQAILIDGLSAILSPESFVQQIQSLTAGCPLLVRDVEPASLAARLSQLGAEVIPIEEAVTVGHIRAALHETTRKSLIRLAETAMNHDWESRLVGDSPPLRHVRHMIRMVGPRRASVLIHGETGTGKEIAARCLHLSSARSKFPFVPVNCGALPAALMEAELFGHVRGAFTGAIQNRVGRFEQAHGGTLFLDEVGELPLELQAKLLRVIQEREFQRLGSSDAIRVDVRIVAATNRDLCRQMERSLFREDLYYRLNVVPLEMPALRDCAGDVPLLARHFAARICEMEGMPAKQLRDDALEKLSRYTWPGNVRQLENSIEMAIALTGPRDLLTPEDFPLPAAGPTLVESPVVAVPDQGLDFEQTVAFIERSILEQALRKTGGNKKAAAEMLRLKRTTLSAKVRSLEPEAACS